MSSPYPTLAFATPRKLPRAHELPGKVVVLDIAFAAEATGTSFDKVTGRLLRDLGPRLVAWVDHHDHDMQHLYANDPRFVLCKKSDHGACPEMITEALVQRIGPYQTIVCHTDFDGLCSAAKWIRGGTEPYPGADADAYAIDTRIGQPSERAETIDQALRARAKDDALRGKIVRFLSEGAQDKLFYAELQEIAREVKVREDEARKLARHYVIESNVAVCHVPAGSNYFDKTILLLIGQERARVSVVVDDSTVTAAASFDSGINLLELLAIEGGMPTRVSLPLSKASETLRLLRAAKL